MRSKDKWDKIYEINENLQYTQHFTFCRTIGCGGIPVKTYQKDICSIIIAFYSVFL